MSGSESTGLFDFDVVPARQAVRGQAGFEAQITNNSDHELTVDLQAFDAPDLEVTFVGGPAAVLDPGESQDVAIAVAPKQWRWTGPGETHRFVVGAVARPGQQPQKTVSVEYTYLPLFSGWTGPVAAAAVIVLVVALALGPVRALAASFGGQVLANPSCTKKTAAAPSEKLPNEVANGVPGDALQIEFGKAMNGLAVDPGLNRIYVADPLLATVFAIDGASDTVACRIPIYGLPVSAALNPSTHRLYISEIQFNKVFVIDTTKNRVVATIDVREPGVLAVDSNRNRVYLAHLRAPFVTIIDGATNTLSGEIRLPDTPLSVAVDEAAGRLIVAGDSGKSWIIDASDNHVLRTLATSGWVTAADPVLHRFYIAAERQLSEVDGDSGNVLRRLVVGADPEGLAIDPQTRRVYVVHNGVDALVRFADQSTDVVGYISTASHEARFVVINPVTHRGYFGGGIFENKPDNALHLLYPLTPYTRVKGLTDVRIGKQTDFSAAFTGTLDTNLPDGNFSQPNACASIASKGSISEEGKFYLPHIDLEPGTKFALGILPNVANYSGPGSYAADHFSGDSLNITEPDHPDHSLQYLPQPDVQFVASVSDDGSGRLTLSGTSNGQPVSGFISWTCSNTGQ